MLRVLFKGGVNGWFLEASLQPPGLFGLAYLDERSDICAMLLWDLRNDIVNLHLLLPIL